MDYSKWNNIEISDDEDECLNIDRSSLFQCNHEARIARMKKQKEEMESLERKKAEYDGKLTAAKQKQISSENIHELAEMFNELKLEKEEIDKIEEKLKEEERKTPWNVDTISKPGFSKTVINTRPGSPKMELTKYSKEAIEIRKFIFFNLYDKEIKHYGKLKDFAESKAYLSEHPHLLSKFTVEFLCDWCLILGLEQQSALVEHVVRQCSNLCYILEFATRRNCHPVCLLDIFFARMQKGKVDFIEEISKHIKEEVIKSTANYKYFY